MIHMQLNVHKTELKHSHHPKTQITKQIYPPLPPLPTTPKDSYKKREVTTSNSTTVCSHKENKWTIHQLSLEVTTVTSTTETR
jgi:hypothetical protein